MGSLSKSGSQTEMSRRSSEWQWHDTTNSSRRSLNTILSLSTRLANWRHSLGVKMNVSALVAFVSWISIMVRPTQAGGEFQNVLTFSLIAFIRVLYSPTLSVLTHTSCLGWPPKLCLINGLCLFLVLLFRLFFSSVFFRLLLSSSQSS